MKEETTTAERSCQNKVMERIEGEQICPRPRSFYIQKEAFVWGLWGISIIIGALAVAVMTFAFLHHQYAFYEATHESYLTFLFDVLPYAWIAAFLLMAFVAVYNLRHTKHGYRYPISHILLSSVVLSVVGGGALHLFGFGYLVDHALGQQMSMYVSQEKMEEHMWQMPEEGRLLGKVTKSIQPPSTMLTFTDIEGKEWQLAINELSADEQELLILNNEVKLIGEVSDDNDEVFYTCGVFSWILGKEPTLSDFETARAAFEQKMYSYEEQAERIANIEDDDDGAVCEESMPVRRMHKNRGS